MTANVISSDQARNRTGGGNCCLVICLELSLILLHALTVAAPDARHILKLDAWLVAETLATLWIESLTRRRSTSDTNKATSPLFILGINGFSVEFDAVIFQVVMYSIVGLYLDNTTSRSKTSLSPY